MGGVLSPSRNTCCGCLLTQMKHLSAFTSLVVQLLHMLTRLCRSRNTRLHSSPAVWYQTCGKGVAHLEQLVVLQGQLFVFFLICATVSSVYTIKKQTKTPLDQWMTAELSRKSVGLQSQSVDQLLLSCVITCCHFKYGIVIVNTQSSQID